MNHKILVKKAIKSSGHTSVSAFAKALGVSAAAVNKWMSLNYVPEKSRKKIADASRGEIHPRFFTPLWEK
jgi:DNA-binding transcriptional regulator YdaS (Cro superfamily)|tara:strand:+ start:812 stop:1021 length:210 start_codon:yes stop_codon:yes gene_type:complete